MKEPSLTERIIKGGGIVLFFSLLLSPLGYLIRVLYSQSLSIEDYGLFYAVLAFFTLLTSYNDLGFGHSLIYLTPKFLKKKDYGACWNMYQITKYVELGTAIGISAIIIPFAPWISENYFRVAGTENLIYLFCLYFIGNSFLSAIINFFNGLQEEKYYSSIHAVRLLFTLVFSGLFAFFDYKYVSYFALSWVIAYGATIIIYSEILRRKFPEFNNHKFVFDRELFKTMFKYALPTLITTSVGSLIVFSDSIFLTIFRGVKEVGIYNIILPLVSISTIFLFPLTNLILPLISSLMENQQDKVKLLIESSLRVIPFAGVYFALFIILFPTQPVNLLFGEKWSGLVEVPLMILAAGFINYLLSYYLATIVSGMGKIRERINASIIIAVLSIFLNAFLVYKYGVVGAVIANSVVYFISAVLFGRIINQEIGFRIPVFYYGKLTLVAAFIYFTVRYLNINPEGWVQYILTGIIYTGVMLGAAYYLSLYKLDMLKLIFKK